MAALRRNFQVRDAVWIAILVAVAFLAALWHLAGSRPVASLEGLLEFRETAPFQYRVLVPALTAAVGAMTRWSIPTLVLAVEWLGWIALLGAAAVWTVSAGRPVTSAVAVLSVALVVGAELVAPVRFRTFAGDVPIGDVNGLLQGATSIAVLPNVFYPWDVWSAAIVLALIAVLLSIHERPTAGSVAGWVVGFVLSCLNRETSVLLVPLSLWAFAPWLSRGRLVLAGIAEVAGWAALLWTIAHLTGAPPNPKATVAGGVYEWYLWTNLRTLTHPLYVVTGVLPFAAGAWALVALWWKDVPTPARVVLALYTLPALAAALVFGVLLESRVFTEAATSMWMAVILTARARASRPGGPAPA